MSNAIEINDLQRRIQRLEAIENPLGLQYLFQALPGLRGFWPLNAYTDTGAAIDQSGNQRTLTYNGNPVYNRISATDTGYIDLDGTGDWLSRADEAGLDITGSESYISSAAQGLTLGGWFKFDAFAADQALISKYISAADIAYWLTTNTTPIARFSIGNGATPYTANSSLTITTNTWYFIAGRYIPSTAVSVFVNGIFDSDTSSIPSSINNSTGAFQIGARNSLIPMNGQAALCFICANWLTENTLNGLYHSSRALFGV